MGMTPLMSQERKADQTGRDAQKNFMLVEKPMPVPENLRPGFDSIKEKDAIQYLNFLSSDSLEGRETGSLGYQIAAEYVSTMFALWGLKPAGDLPERPSFRRRFMNPSQSRRKQTRSYLQQVEMKEILNIGGSAKVEWVEGSQYKAKMFDKDVDYQYSSRRSQVLKAAVVFVGYGISEKSLKFDEYKGVDVKGKIVMMLTEIPRKGDPRSPFEKKEIKEKYDPPRMRMRRFVRSQKNKIAKDKGAVAIIMVENSTQKKGDIAKRVLDSQKINDERPIIPGKRRRFALIESSTLMPFGSTPTIRVSRQMADEILKLSGADVLSLKQKIEKTLKPSSMVLRGVTFTISSTVKTRLINSPNVLGYIEGSDPELKEEFLVIGAHLDHLGKRGDYIFNGADDNGSGSVAVMEVAQAFALNPVKPKRSILFALWTGEENGLLGSRHYVSHPSFPIEKTIANINLDMVSREWDKRRLKMMSRLFGTQLSDETIKKIDVSKFITFSYDANHPKTREAAKLNNQYVGMTMIFRESRGVYTGGGGSDHMSFGLKKIPWCYFMAGVTEDFHQPSDSIHKVSEKLMTLTTKLVFLTAFSLANQ
jgi:hypothetical protein